MAKNTNNGDSLEELSSSVADSAAKKLNLSSGSIDLAVSKELKRLIPVLQETNNILSSIENNTKSQQTNLSVQQKTSLSTDSKDPKKFFTDPKNYGTFGSMFQGLQTLMGKAAPNIIPKTLKQEVAPEKQQVVLENQSQTQPIFSNPANNIAGSAAAIAPKSELEEIDKPKKVEIVNFAELAKILPEALKDFFSKSNLGGGGDGNPRNSPNNEGGGGLDFGDIANWGVGGMVAGKAWKGAKWLGKAAKGGAGKALIAGAGLLGGKKLVEKMQARAAEKLEKEAAEKLAKEAGTKAATEVAEKAGTEVVKDVGTKAGKEVAESVGTKAATEVAEKAALKVLEEGAEKGIKAKIIAAAAKRIPKALGGAIGKSVPFLGWAIGAGFAIPRLLKGEYVEAAMEVGSSVGSAATAIPVTVALLAKDVYKDVYGVAPEKDPQVGERMKIVKDSVTDAAAEFLGKEKKPEQSEISAEKTPASSPSVVPTNIKEATSSAVIDNPKTEYGNDLPEGKENKQRVIPPPIIPPSVKNAAAPETVSKPLYSGASFEDNSGEKSKNPIEREKRRKEKLDEFVKKGYRTQTEIPSEELEEYLKEFPVAGLPPEFSKSAARKLLEIGLTSKGAKADTGSNNNVVEQGGKVATAVDGSAQSTQSKTSPVTPEQPKAPAIVPEPVKEAIAPEANKPLYSGASFEDEPKKEEKSGAAKVTEQANKQKEAIEGFVKKGFRSLNDIPKEELEAYTKEFAPKSMSPANGKSFVHNFLAIQLRGQGAKADTGSNNNVVEQGGKTATADGLDNTKQGYGKVNELQKTNPQLASTLKDFLEKPSGNEWISQLSDKDLKYLTPKSQGVESGEIAREKANTLYETYNKTTQQATPPAIVPESVKQATSSTEPTKSSLMPTRAGAITKQEEIKQGEIKQGEAKKWPSVGAKSSDLIKEILEYVEGKKPGEHFWGTPSGSIDITKIPALIDKLTKEDKEAVNIAVKNANNEAGLLILGKKVQNIADGKTTAPDTKPLSTAPDTKPSSITPDTKPSSATLIEKQLAEMVEKASAEPSPAPVDIGSINFAGLPEITNKRPIKKIIPGSMGPGSSSEGSFQPPAITPEPAKEFPRSIVPEPAREPIQPRTEYPTFKQETSPAGSSKTETILEKIANNTGSSDEKLRNLIEGFNNLARVLEKTTGEKMPTIINQGGEKQAPRLSDYTGNGNPIINNFRVKTVEGSRFQAV